MITAENLKSESNNIQQKISDFQKKSREETIKEAKGSFDGLFGIFDAIVEAINEIDRRLHEATLNEKNIVYNHTKSVEDIIKVAKILSSELYKSPYYGGLKTAYKELNLGIDNLEESLDDIKFYFEADKDPSYQNLFSQIAAL